MFVRYKNNSKDFDIGDFGIGDFDTRDFDLGDYDLGVFDMWPFQSILANESCCSMVSKLIWKEENKVLEFFKKFSHCEVTLQNSRTLEKNENWMIPI